VFVCDRAGEREGERGEREGGKEEERERPVHEEHTTNSVLAHVHIVISLKKRA
jgi:hypothetical protein